MAPIRILHLMTGLNAAGAELALLQLARGLDRSRFEIRVIALRASDAAAETFSAASGCPTESLCVRGVLDAPVALMRLRARVRSFAPDILQSWLYHADFFATLARSAAPSARLIWSLRNAALAQEGRRDWAFLTRMLARLSRSVDLVIGNAQVVLSDHAALGYRPRADVLIPNGWVVEAPASATTRQALRADLGLVPDDVAILMPARFARQKDHATLLAAAQLATARDPRLRFFAAGLGVTADALSRLDPGAPVRALGERADVRDLMTAMDGVTLSSAYGEGCPNSVGEAMARGVPVIVTQAGGTAELVGDAGTIVPPRDPARLAEAFLALARLSPDQRAAGGEAGRARVQARFSYETMLQRHVAAYEALVARR